MLLSHNFAFNSSKFPELSREEFAQIFINGLVDRLQCRLVNNPHWIVEILYPQDLFSPSQIGELCGKLLAEKRLNQQQKNVLMPDILILGGMKTSPATNTSPDSLQPGEWGVDVVETDSAENFLTSIAWSEMIASKPVDSIFQVKI